MDFNNDIVTENGTGHGTIEIDKLPFNNWFLMTSPVPISLITVSYLLFVLKIGPELMKNRKPFQLKNTLIIYNVIQVAVSYGLFHMCVNMISKHGLVSQSCVMDTDANRFMITSAIYYYFLAKLSEFLDTVLFVLRKKDNQVTFLHVYHHTLMVFVSWSTLKYEPNYVPVFLGAANSFVHILMYTYYGLSSFPSLAKYLWWKKYITTIQLIQFVTIFIHFCIVHTTSECKPSYTMSFVTALNTSLFLFMFGKFYVNTYSKKNTVEARKSDQKAKLNVTKGKETLNAGTIETAFVSNNKAVYRKFNSVGNR